MENLLGHPKNLRAGGVAQWLKMLTLPPRPDNFISIPATHVMEGTASDTLS